MSLDQNLFTLNVTPNEKDPAVLDLVDPIGRIHYHKRREAGNLYRIDLYDPLSEALLASATSPSASSKHKTVELYNPSQVIELKSVGTLSFKWSFRWEDHDFEWKREACYMIRKPDPAVLVAVTKEPPGRLKTATVQILDYNLNRFDIEDRKGLEIAILTTLLTFHDMNDLYHTPQAEGTQPAPLSRQATQSPPPPPPKPIPKTGVDRIAEMHALRGEVNEITIVEEGSIPDYAQHAAGLLDDEAMLFITIRSASPAEVPKVLKVVEEVKRIRHKNGLSNATDLHQYVIYDNHASSSAPGPRIIKLDDPPARGNRDYRPPSSLTVHLSKIDMPELRPRAEPTSSRAKGGTPVPPPPSRARTPQPQPSPSQLNNPGLYVAPPPAGRKTSGAGAGGLWGLRW
ncbi:hypothetical protein BV25DRAFT_1871265 [Artomyces pyxidatus]|uniref:Uncharacterized protein n=1 Tax=Artomyces pyxidatus TaxID=48021 RepID=A0ACB8SVU4_9AGAM|nr:hypothetical protein BV25DRAFT_1871265 [Artomyces pyxidatus]